MNVYRIRIDVAANKSALIFELSRYLKLSSALLWVLRWWLQFEIVSSHYSMKSVASEKHAWLWIRISVAGATVTVQLSNDEPRPCRAFSNNDVLLRCFSLFVVERRRFVLPRPFAHSLSKSPTIENRVSLVRKFAGDSHWTNSCTIDSIEKREW